MSPSSTPERPEVQQLVALIREVTGNVVTAERHAFVEEIAQRRARTTGQGDLAAYLHALASGELAGDWDQLISLITIKESYFFRAPQQFEAIQRHVLPLLLAARAESRRLRFWSAACARGEEPGTLAMLLAEERALAGWEWSILATDVDEEAIEGARRGLYGERAVAQVPPALRERWLSPRGKVFELAPALRERIDYQCLNLAHPPYNLPVAFDVILLRNVLIYFRRPLQRWVVSQVGQLLTPPGYLFLGASETLWQIQDELEAADLGTCFGYRHRAEGTAEPPSARETRREAAEARARLKAKPAPPPATRASRATASHRPITSEAEPSPVAPAARRPPATPPAPPAASIATAPRPALGSQEQLMAAARLLADNEVDAARRALEAILSADPSEPAAHALEGFLHDLAGRDEEAVASYRAALYLVPELFQARLLLADCLLRLGRREMAEHQYREVLTTLAGGRSRALTALEDLPFPDSERARRRCRQALGGG